MITGKQRIRDVERDAEAGQRLRAFTSIRLFRVLLRFFRPFRLETLKKWKLPLLGDLVDFVNGEPNPYPEGHPRRSPLWEGKPPLDSGGEEPYFVSYPLKHEAPAVLLVPGGAFNSVVMKEEGEELAKRFNEKGYHAFIVRYRVSPNRYPAPQLDVMRAMQLIRQNEKAWNIQPHRVILAGFSAGGHLCASLPGLYPALKEHLGELKDINPRPDGMILGYPAINMDSKFFGVSIGIFLLGSRHDTALRKEISAQNLVDGAFPLTYLFSVDGDPLVNVQENALTLEAALKKQGVPVKMHLFSGKEHGSGAVPVEQWIDEALAFVTRQMDGSQKQNV